MYTVQQSCFIALVCLIFVVDIIVFLKCETYKQGTSFMISVCLAMDLLCRLAQLTVKLSKAKHDYEP